MKQIATSSFNDGLNFDLHPIVTPNSVLTDNLNGTFITYNGNEFCLQNDKGNTIKAFLTPGFIPIGIKEHNGVLYIVSYKEKTGESEIGTYPGVDWKSNSGLLDRTKYTPLNNFTDAKGKRTIFRTPLLKFDSKHPVEIEVQDSYDGSINLILSDGQSEPRIINTGFSVIGDNYKLIKRTNDSNQYQASNFLKSAELIQNSTALTRFQLDNVLIGGQLKGGTYTFYLRYGDADGNKTDIVCESSIISIFKGTLGDLHSISGTLADERTDKSIQLTIDKIDQTFNKIYLSYSREYSDTNGYRMYECCELVDGYTIEKETQSIIITGFEEIQSISEEDINIAYHSITSVKTMTQQQDMLFLGNIAFAEETYTDLQNYSYKIKACVKQSETSIGNVNPLNYIDNSGLYEYYNPKNIYETLGYWPGEYYRLGIVYIKSDGTKTPAFNLRGCEFGKLNITNWYDETLQDADDEGFYTLSDDENAINHYYNKYGVFKTPENTIGETDIIKNDGVYPWYFDFVLPEELPSDIIGYFFVRQKRIPETILQGLKIGIEVDTHIPIVQTTTTEYKTESFLTPVTVDGSEVLQLKYSPKSPTGEQVSTQENRYYQYLKFKWAYASESDPVPPIIRSGYLYAILTRNSIDNSFLACRIMWEEEFETTSLPSPNFNITETAGLDIVYIAFNLKNKNYCDKVRTRELDPEGRSLLYVNGIWEVSASEITIDFDYTGFGIAFLDYVKNFSHRFPASDVPSPTEQLSAFITIPHNTSSLLNATVQKGSFGLLSLDPYVNNSINTMLDGGEVLLTQESGQYIINNNNTLNFTKSSEIPTAEHITNKNVYAVYMNSDSKTKVINSRVFQTTIGNSTAIQDIGFIKPSDGEIKYAANYKKIVRGIYTPYIGIVEKEEYLIGDDIADFVPGIYSLKKAQVSLKNAMIVRMNDHSPFYAITDMTDIHDNPEPVFRGDCFTVTQSHRMIRNFVDNSYPYTEKIVDENNWNKYYAGYNNMNSDEHNWSDINVTDVNTVSLGHWVSFKCLSSYNIGLRSVDGFNVTETALLGTERKFWPLSTSTATPDKIPDSTLLNDGYNSTVGRIRRILQEEVPYLNREHSNRIMFSNKNVSDQFVNGYRIFQGLSYQDYDKQYGQIVKLENWGNNILCIFEHGISLLPINEKALMQTTTEQTIHIYGHGVLPEQMSIISQDYGTRYAGTVIRTPIGIYGIDTDAKKIWRFSDKQGFETLSDMKIESFLNHNLDALYNINMSIRDIRTHYNSKKGDIMFTWYYPETNTNEERYYSICFNERQGIWTTRYDWLPIVSENINGEFYSLQQGLDNNVVNGEVVGGIGIYDHDPIQSSSTKWYGKQHPFEFEFVVSDPIGMHKIYENLQIISNNVQPEELQFEFIGDSYMFNKERVYHSTKLGTFDGKRVLKANYNNTSSTEDPNITDVYSDTFRMPSKTGVIRQQDENEYRPFRNTSILKDRDYVPNMGRIEKTENATDQYHLVIPQECRNIESWGRRLGNIHYKADSWYTTIEPILYDARLNDPQWTKFKGEVIKWNSARIRDKWCKIRVRYSGEDLAVITAIKTIVNI